MENATKALLIAAAVLIAILIISLTLVIYRQGTNAVSGADLSETEAAEFNGKFTVYEVNSESTSQVNALLNTVFSHNKQEEASGSNLFVSIDVQDKSGASITSLASDETSVKNAESVVSVTGNKYYTVKCNYTGTIITSITVKEK